MSFWSKLSRPIIGLAPMDGVTDPPFRHIVATYGKPDLMITEFTSVEAIRRGVAREMSGLTFGEVERPVVAQVYGAQPEAFFHVAQIVCALGFDGLDINMGCPAKNVASRGCGAALIDDPVRARAILKAAHDGIRAWADGAPLSETPPGFSPPRDSPLPRRKIPLSVKTRIGCDRVVVAEWVAHLLEEKPAAITLHGRTLRQGYGGQADWEAIALAGRVAKGSGTLILGNGDVGSPAEARRRADETGIDGVLIGRATLGHPWLFGDGGTPPPVSSRLDIAMEHARRFEAMWGAARFAGMRKHLGWYCKGFPGAAELRNQLVRARNADEVEKMLFPYRPALSLGHL
jgi:nifR3 family TIM-barrel protein